MTGSRILLMALTSLIGTHLLHSQSFILLEEDSMIFSDLDLDISDPNYDIPLDLYFSNVTDRDIEVRWRREFGSSCPDSWDIFSSDPLISYTPDINESQIDIPMTPQDSNFLFRQVVRPNGVSGCCEIRVIFSDALLGTPADTGYLRFELNDNNCLATSASYHTSGFLTVVPNPFDDHVYLKSFSEGTSIQIMTLRGHEVKRLLWQGGQTLFLGDLKSGIYFMRVQTTDGELMLHKIIKR